MLTTIENEPVHGTLFPFTDTDERCIKAAMKKAAKFMTKFGKGAQPGKSLYRDED